MKAIIKQTSLIIYFLIFAGIHDISVARINFQGVYQCPMKCEGDKEYSQPGLCPVCELQMVEVQSCNSVTTENVVTANGCVNFSGEMMNVFHNGQIAGTISIDSIDPKLNLYGVGPLENLKGEIMISEGHSYISKVTPDGKISVREDYKVKAPFFVYANVSRWNIMSLPDSITTLKQLEGYLDVVTKYNTRPFCFKIEATVDASIHVDNLPDNAIVKSHKDVSKNQKNYNLKKTPVEIVGFFSTEHQGIFTHHDSFIHAHLITADKTKMGHCDKITFKKRTARLFLPQ